MITKVIIIKITILSFSLFLLAGCDSDRFSQVVEVEIPEHESRLVLNARFSSLDTGVTALVANSLGILATSAYDIPEDAAVRLFRDGEWVGGDFFFLPDKLKYFLSLDEPLGTAPRLYRMEVSAPGYDPISAEQVMPVPAGVTLADAAALSSAAGEIDSVVYSAVEQSPRRFCGQNSIY